VSFSPPIAAVAGALASSHSATCKVGSRAGPDGITLAHTSALKAIDGPLEGDEP